MSGWLVVGNQRMMLSEMLLPYVAIEWAETHFRASAGETPLLIEQNVEMTRRNRGRAPCLRYVPASDNCLGEVSCKEATLNLIKHLPRCRAQKCGVQRARGQVIGNRAQSLEKSNSRYRHLVFFFSKTFHSYRGGGSGIEARICNI